VVEDKELTGQRLVEVVEPWLSDRVTGARTAAAALSYGRPDAARNVARLVLDQLEQGPGKVWS
jgi:UDP-N-acetylglucosamine:LPS N-acetylglucosamine transferase